MAATLARYRFVVALEVNIGLSIDFSVVNPVDIKCVVCVLDVDVVVVEVVVVVVVVVEVA